MVPMAPIHHLPQPDSRSPRRTRNRRTSLAPHRHTLLKNSLMLRNRHQVSVSAAVWRGPVPLRADRLRTEEAAPLVPHPLRSRATQADVADRHHPLPPDTGEDAEILNFLDNHSRYLLACVAFPATGKSMVTVFRDTITGHGVPTSVLSEDSIGFTTRFAGRSCSANVAR